jgi:hypothetical protein
MLSNMRQVIKTQRSQGVSWIHTATLQRELFTSRSDGLQEDIEKQD